MKVHFICTGNTYRSRLAEAYLNSKNLDNTEAYSSGIEADNNINGPISWYAAKILFDFRLVNFMSDNWQKTSKELLDKSDYIVFLQKSHYDYCKKILGFERNDYEIWDIDDIENIEVSISDEEKINLSEETFEKIKSNVDKLDFNK